MNIVITWPKARPLRSYIEECAKAEAADLHINFHVGSPPDTNMGDRCYVVYAGFIRGYHEVVGVFNRDDVVDPTTQATMQAGIYIVRNALWHPMMGAQIPMRGFQGWRYAKAPL